MMFLRQCFIKKLKGIHIMGNDIYLLLGLALIGIALRIYYNRKDGPKVSRLKQGWRLAASGTYKDDELAALADNAFGENDDFDRGIQMYLRGEDEPRT